MKHFKFLMVALTFLMGGAFTSCMNSDNESSYDFGEYVTVTQDIYGSGLMLKGDASGYTFIPSNPSMLNISSTTTEYPDRAFVYFKFIEDTNFTEGKTKYNVSIVSVGLYLATREFCDVDTLGDHINSTAGTPIHELGAAWAANGYVTLNFVFPYETKLSYKNFDMYAEKAEGNVLYVKFHQNSKTTSSERGNGIMSFRLPTRGQLSYQFPELETFGATNDSVFIKITADGQNSTALEVKNKLKVKLQSY